MLLLLALVVGMTSGYNQRCIEDKDFNNVQTVDFDIPDVNKTASYVLGDTGQIVHGPHWLFYQWSAYYFGVLQPQPNAKTIIKAELYNDVERSEDQLVYGVEIDCDNMNWRSYVTSDKTGKRADFNTGALDASVWWGGSCTDGDIWDLILHQDNERKFNWIFNGQPLQGEPKVKLAKNGKPSMQRIPGTNRRKLVQNYHNRTYSEHVPTQFKASTAKALTITTTGRAVITRMAWGQCDVWPKDIYVDKCFMAKAWMQRRSKAHKTKEGPKGELLWRQMQLLSLMKYGAAEDLGLGLGVRGNQNDQTNAECVSEQYWNFYAMYVHMDTESRNGVFRTKTGTPSKNDPSLYGRLYCCCTDMHTGVVPDVYESCVFPCEEKQLKCASTYDTAAASEVYKAIQDRIASGKTAEYQAELEEVTKKYNDLD